MCVCVQASLMQPTTPLSFFRSSPRINPFLDYLLVRFIAVKTLCESSLHMILESRV